MTPTIILIFGGLCIMAGFSCGLLWATLRVGAMMDRLFVDGGDDAHREP